MFGVYRANRLEPEGSYTMMFLYLQDVYIVCKVIRRAPNYSKVSTEIPNPVGSNGRVQKLVPSIENWMLGLQ